MQHTKNPNKHHYLSFTIFENCIWYFTLHFPLLYNIDNRKIACFGSEAGLQPQANWHITSSINRFPYFSIRELSKHSDTLIPSARTRRAPKLVFYIQSIQSLMLFVRDTGMLPMFTDAPNHIGFANFCLRTLFHFSVSSG